MLRFSYRFFLIAALLFCGLLPLRGLQAETDPVVGQVAGQRGVVRLLRGSASLASLPGAEVRQGDRILTESESRVLIEFRDGSSLAIGAGSQVAISSYATAETAGRQSGVVDLVLGILRMRLLPSPQSAGFEMRTKTTVASVRGTDWIAEAVPGKSSYFVVEGLVDVSSVAGGDVARLEPGLGVDVPAGKAVGAVKRWGDKRVADVLARTAVP